MGSVRPLERAVALTATQHGLITALQCRDLGLSRNAVQRLIARGAWTREAPGVYRFAGSPRTWHGRALAAALAAGPEALVSHRSAAHLWGLDGFGPTGRIEVTVRRHSRPRQRPGVVVHETGAFDLADPARRYLVPVTGAARTLVDVAAVADDPVEVLRALDEIRRLRLATWPELWETFLLHSSRGRPGIALCRAVIAKRYGKRVPDTEFARLFLRLLEAAGLPEPVSEHVVVVGDARFRLDCTYPGRRIAIELDGKGHLAEAAFEADRVRDNRLELAGWIVLRFTWQRFVSSPDEIVADVQGALAARPARG
jgi:Protein of unknown function (DUF559)/Transcriptional regulator, AbiEi antitoxin